MRKVSKSFSYYRELPDRQKEYVLNFEENCNSVIKCIEQNNEIIKLIIKDVNGMFQNNKPSKVIFLNCYTEDFRFLGLNLALKVSAKIF